MKCKLTAKVDYGSHTRNDKTHTMMGGDPTNPLWKDYIDQYKTNFKPYASAMRRAVIENNLFMTGESMDRAGFHFSFKDGTHIHFTWRGWGDLLQAIRNKREGYMAYYM